MPKTAVGQNVMQKFVAEYGKKKGKGVFFGKANSDPKFAKTMGEASVYKRGHPGK